MDRPTLAAMIDHTLLKPEATVDDVVALCEEATDLGVAAVCVSPSMLPITEGLGVGIDICTVIGFPSGAHQPAVKAHEAEGAVDAGATEVDMVINLGLAMAGEWLALQDDIGAVRAAAGSALLKVIIESAALSDDQIVAACRAAETAGADYVKTSTGFHPCGGASVEAVRLMAQTVGDRLGVKASGGIRDAATALAMVDAGATRIGCSASRAILEGLS
ncbi:MAG TPA: deoxyribose-phosphate aldolase [Acidimicrobiales bacterium]|jgi:deoxyribose-phosphate aldolase|nr:deoxyribose-phosphate aldolase [Acidimicrobiales bacterium]